jgi:glycosyltransferase involved in cell wall biosynthesis
MKSNFLTLNSRDFIKGLIVVVICTFVTGLYQLLANGGAVNWITIKPVVIAAFGAAVSYLTKNLLTNSKGDFMTREPVK